MSTQFRSRVLKGKLAHENDGREMYVNVSRDKKIKLIFFKDVRKILKIKVFSFVRVINLTS